MNEIVALAAKDIKVLLRDKSGSFFTIFFPLLFSIFFGMMFSGSGNDDNSMGIWVVDEDSTETSQAFVKKLDESGILNVTRANRKDASERVRRGRTAAYVAIPPGFEKEWHKMFTGKLEVELGVDPKRHAEAGLLYDVLNTHASQRLQAGLGGASGGGSFQPIHIRSESIDVQRRGPNNAFAVSFPQGIIWGLMSAAAAFGISLVVERTHGTLVRLQISPVGRMKILGGKAVACFVTVLTVGGSLWIIAITAFGVRPNSIFHLVLALLCIAVGFVGIMMLLSVLGRTEQSSGGIGWAALMVMAMIGGGMIPLFAMPSWMKSVSNISPIKWAILSMEGAVWRQFSFVEMLQPCGILIAVGVVCFGIGVRAFRWLERA